MKCKHIIFILSFILILTPFMLLRGCKVECKKLCECKAVLDTTIGVLSSETGVLSIPGNAGITKIIATVIDNPLIHVDGAVISSGPADQLDFAYAFTVDPATGEGKVEIDFAQPVCVGEEGATMVMTPFRFDFQEPTGYIMTLTVVYCPDFCGE